MSELDITGLSNIKISVHTDADGIYSGVLLSYAIEVETVLFPERFGDTVIGDSIPDIILDQVPVDSNYSGLVLDHHPHHPRERRYRLIYDTVPTGLIVYNILKDRIPERHRWKVVGSLVGDGQPELIPVEIWRQYPILLEEVGSIVDRRDLIFYRSPVWSLLSSPVNSACRCNMEDVAFKIVRDARDPYDIIFDPALQACKKRVEEEMSRIIKQFKPIDLGYYIYWEFDSELKLTGYLASRAESIYKKTAIVVNRKRKILSIRGVLSDLLKEYLSSKYSIGGHSGYSGGYLREDQDTRILLEDLRELQYKIRRGDI